MRYFFSRAGIVIVSSTLSLLPLSGQTSRRTTAQAHYQKAEEALRQNRYDEAAREFGEVIRLNPKLAEAHANLGVIYYTQGKLHEALEAFQQALTLKPSLSRVENYLGILKARGGRIDEALPLLERSFKKLTDEEWRQRTGLLLAEIYAARMDLYKALDVVRTLEKAHPSNPEILYVMYRIHSELGAKAISRLVRTAPDSARLHQVTAELLESQGDFPRAIEQYRKALELDPNLPGIHRSLGVAILNARQDEASRSEAQRHFEFELATNPADAYSEYQLGEIYWNRYQYEDALKHFTRALELRSNFVDALIAVGKVMISQGLPEKALYYLREAERLDPENEVAHYRLAQAYRKLGRHQDAHAEIALFEKLRAASASIGAIYRQVQRNPVTGQSIESGQSAK